MRKTEFANGEYYHIFNRGVDKREIFLDASYYERFVICANLLNDERDGLMQDWRDFKRVYPKAKLSDFLPEPSSGRNPRIEFIAYCFNPNHYHFILKQLQDNGIQLFMHKLGTSYTNYFNTRNKRNGALFQGKFKASHIDSNEYLLYLSAYVNKNNFIHGYNKTDEWPYSSLLNYTAATPEKILLNKEVVLGQFDNTGQYANFINENALYMREKKELQRYLIED